MELIEEINKVLGTQINSLSEMTFDDLKNLRDALLKMVPERDKVQKRKKIKSLDVPLSQLSALINLYWNLQKAEIALSNRIWSMNQIGEETGDLVMILGKVREIKEGDVEPRIKLCVHNHPLWTGWLKHIGGIGEILTAQLIHLITGKKHTEACKKKMDEYYSKKERGEKRAKRFTCDCPVMEIERFDTVSSVWKYAGLDVVEGKAPKKKKGQKITWNPKLRSVGYNIGESLVKTVKGQYRPWYDKFKEEEVRRHPDLSRGHLDRRARRKTVKLFISHMFEVWYALKGLTPPKTYVEEKLGHVHHIPPPEFKKGKKEEEKEEAEKEEKPEEQ